MVTRRQDNLLFRCLWLRCLSVRPSILPSGLSHSAAPWRRCERESRSLYCYVSRDLPDSVEIFTNSKRVTPIDNLNKMGVGKNCDF